jgi:Domain of unknown function (DUF4124)
MQIPSVPLATVAVLIALPCGTAWGDIYRCSDADGKISYSDSPCPHGAVAKSNITVNVGACTTAECEAKRQQDAEDARQRLRADKEGLAERTNQRRQEDLEIERDRARLEELRWRQSVEARLAAAADDAANAAAYAPYYPVYPAFPSKPCRHCVRPQQPHHSGPKSPDQDPGMQGVRLRARR